MTIRPIRNFDRASARVLVYMIFYAGIYTVYKHISCEHVNLVVLPNPAFLGARTVQWCYPTGRSVCVGELGKHPLKNATGPRRDEA